MGNSPEGTITFTDDDRVVVLITASQRPKPKDKDQGTVSEADQIALFQSMMAYAGDVIYTDSYAAKCIIDIAWNESWVGNEQLLDFIVNEDSLSMNVGPILGRSGEEVTAILIWVKNDSLEQA